MSGRNPTRIYVGNLPYDVTPGEIENEFQKYGNIIKVELKKTVSGGSYCFLQYADSSSCRDAIDGLNGRRVFKNSQALRVEMPMGPRGERERGGGKDGFRSGELRNRGRYLLEIKGLPSSGSWQDLKDHFREVGNVCFAQVYQRRRGDSMDDNDNGGAHGEVSFNSRREMLDAIDRLDGSTFRSHEGEKTRITVREKIHGRGDERYNDRGGANYSDREHDRDRHRRNDDDHYNYSKYSHGNGNINGRRDRSYTPPSRRTPSPYRDRSYYGSGGGGRRSPSYENHRDRSRTPERSRERHRHRSFSRDARN